MSEERIVFGALSRAFRYDPLLSAFVNGSRIVVTDWEMDQFQGNPSVLTQYVLKRLEAPDA
jgi:hypothetical protein